MYVDESVNTGVLCKSRQPARAPDLYVDTKRIHMHAFIRLHAYPHDVAANVISRDWNKHVK